MLVVGLLGGLAAPGFAQPEPVEVVEPEPEPTFPEIQIHGFASEGGFISTANEYIGPSSRGSLELFEAGLNVTTEPVERLRVGLQLFSRTVGSLRDAAPRLDWAYLDYRWQSWLGIRAGIVRMPFGLYNEYSDIDSARLSILMPQSIYALRNRDALLSQTGFALYGNRSLGSGGELDYQGWLGSLTIPENALTLVGADLESVQTRYVTGAQLHWTPPVEGLRVGGTVLRASIDFNLRLDPASLEELVMAGLVPADFDGELVVSQRPTTFAVASAEYLRGPWMLAGEYSRTWTHQQTTLPDLIPATDTESEQFYVMASYRIAEQLEAGAYYSVNHRNVDDRRGRQVPFAQRRFAFQRDVAATVRYDVNDHWLWKVEAHFIDGAADLKEAENPDPERYWGLFLFKTTVTF